MKLKQIILKNFRAYKDETRIDINDLTVFIGKNDIGKSSILEALEIFFNSVSVKMERDDACKDGDDSKVTIGCAFEDLPTDVIVDENARTTLKDEYLLNSDGLLEIHKVFDCSARRVEPAIFAVANHPSAEGFSDLLLLRNSDLKKRLEQAGINDQAVNKSINNSMRKAIWRNCPNLRLGQQLVPLDKEDAKKIWASLEEIVPVFALFQADRSSRDDDAEVQDPMKTAVLQAVKEIQPLLDEVKNKVKQSATDVADRTLEKLREWDSSLARQLFPVFRAEPKWDQIFKLSLTGDNDIPINKRGSGVRRLVLLSFFRAEAERRYAKNAPGLIYAVEEPETSQHPNYQKLLLEAFLQLSHRQAQILITTHNPAIASFVPKEDIRYVHKDGQLIKVESATDGILETIAGTLGVLPDNRIKVLVFVEGTSDIEILKCVSAIYHANDATVPDLSNNPHVAFIPLGGSNLGQWVNQRYLKEFHRPELHLYDKGNDNPPKYQAAVDEVNARAAEEHYATLTGKREIENYLHKGAIEAEYGIQIPDFTDTDSVPSLVAKAVHEAAQGPGAWDTLEPKRQQQKISHCKKRLSAGVVSKMTYEQLLNRDPNQDIPIFLKIIGQKCEGVAVEAVPAD